MGLQCFNQEDFDAEYDKYVITGFELAIGNNYTAHHFVRFLCEQRPDVVEFMNQQRIALGDDVIFEFRGSYGNHTEHWAMSDLVDFLRAEEKRMEMQL